MHCATMRSVTEKRVPLMAGIPPLCMTFPLSREKLKYLPFACVSNILSLSLSSIFPPVSLFLPSSFSFFLPFFLSFISPRRREGEDNDDKWRVDNCSMIKITTVDYKVMRKAINTSSSSFGRVKSGAKFRSSNSNQVEAERIINAYGGSKISRM